MIYRILVSTRATKDLQDLPLTAIRRIRTVIDGLAIEPRPHGSQAMAGIDNTYRIRVRNYRVVYTVDDGEQQVVIARIGHRRDVYRRL